jgi:hypothetical protein
MKWEARTYATLHCLWALQRGWKPCDVLASVGAAHHQHSSWDSAITALARRWNGINQGSAA